MGLTPIRVGQLNSYIGRVLKMDPLLSDISVLGEISNLKFHSSGHIYFSLKDETSKINCFLPAQTAPRISCPMEEGMEVIASGFISVYERGGYYSLHISDLQANGVGALAARFEKLKNKLQAKGYFDPARKKEIPFFPDKVAVVTSPTGAAVRDILKIIQSRNNYVDVLIVPVLVQGPAAAADIAAAIDDLNQNHRDVDVIICGRGGGSMEELWAFNEEAVAESIYRSEIPVISAVGHETDFTIADFTADLRAETPTAAAAKAVPDTAQLSELIDTRAKEMKDRLLSLTELAEKRLAALDPAAFAGGIRTRIEYEQMHLDQLSESMTHHLKERIGREEQRIELLLQTIETANPFSILSRGYSMVTDEQGRVIRSVGQMSDGQDVTIRVSDGTAGARLSEVRKESMQ